MLRLSVLDLAPIIQGSEAAAALKHAKRRAALDQISPDRVGKLRDVAVMRLRDCRSSTNAA
jgi:hypothetical protein